MPKLTREKKKEEVARLADQFSRAKLAIFALYRGLTVRELTEIRQQLFKERVEFKVVKTSLVKRALEQLKLPVPSADVLAQPVAVAFSYDNDMAPARLLFAASKTNDKLQMLAGLIDGSLVDRLHLVTLAQLPSHKELVGRLVGTLANLPHRLVFSLRYPVGSFTNLIRQQHMKEA